MRKTLSAIAAVALAFTASSALAAAPCKDAKGKFIKCEAAAAKPAPKCKDAKGKFAKCSAPGAKPIG